LSVCARRRDAFDERSLALAAMLQVWDVLRVYQSNNRPPDDEEYDDLVDPIRDWLESGATPEELSARLCRRLESHYGLQCINELADLDFMREVHSWWWSGR
jgi:hypothetical protein